MPQGFSFYINEPHKWGALGEDIITSLYYQFILFRM
jgi:hypothetical protein